jgi:hypothetical protein
MKKYSPPNTPTLPWQQPVWNPLLRWLFVSLFAVMITPVLQAAFTSQPTIGSLTSINITSNSATVGGSMTSAGVPASTERGVVYSITALNSSPQVGGPNVFPAAVAGGALGPFTVGITDLAPGTQYSFRVYATNGVDTTHSTEVATFETLHVLPTISTPTKTDITTDPVSAISSATLGGNVTLAGAEVVERGVVYSLTGEDSNPEIGDEKATAKPVLEGPPGTTGPFTVAVTGLAPFKLYSFKAYVKNDAGTSYTSPVTTFLTPAVVPPQATPTVAPQLITGTGATLAGEVTSDGGRGITERGFVYSVRAINDDPEIGGTGVSKSNVAGTTGAFTKAVTGLKPGTEYVCKSFAINASGRSYSTSVTFTTLAAAPTVISPTKTSISSARAILGGNVTSDGGSAITARGVVYSIRGTNPDPLLLIPGVGNATSTNNATGVFAVAVTGLTPGTEYAFKAYASNVVNGITLTTYSPVSFFTTLAGAPAVATAPPLEDSNGVVTLRGTVTNNNGAAVTKRGVVYSRTEVSTNPRIGRSGVTNKAAGSGDGPFSVTATGLWGGKTYAYRAYATNSKGTTYTTAAPFTAPTTAPTVSKPTSGLVGATSASLGGNVIRDNGAAILERGVEYSTSRILLNNGNGDKEQATGTTGTFRIKVSQLTPKTEYFFRAYARNNEGTSYSAVGSFTTKTAAPIVNSPTVDQQEIGATSAILGGNVASDGGLDITERGIVYSVRAVNSSPKIGLNGVKKATANGTTGVFTKSVTGLKADTIYSFRAYATNSKGTRYSTVATFRTAEAAPQ